MILKTFTLLFVIFAIQITTFYVNGVTILSNNYDFLLDKDNRLISNWLVYTESPACESLSVIDNMSNKFGNPYRQIGLLSKTYATTFFELSDTSSNKCSLACIDMGYHVNYINQIFPERKFTIEEGKYDENALKNWYMEQCNRREVGFVHSLDNNVTIYWLNDQTNERVYNGEFMKGERQSAWRVTYIGHTFELVDSVTQESIGKYQIMCDSFIFAGNFKSGVDPTFAQHPENDIKNLFKIEWDRSQSVKRTFTPIGFGKSKLPKDLFASMSAFYYNNRNNQAREEWLSRGLFVNWWEQDSHLIVMPWKLKKYWQSRLKDLVEIWSNTTLELTDIYGLRRYNEGARLLTHVDRTSTHAASLIINIAQGNVASPWPVEIYDHANRLHEIEMEEGDIVYYESAKCLHGRMRPLTGRGSYYVNLFAHYRPLNDPEWFQKPTPPDHAQPLIDIHGIDIKKALPSLSSTKEQLQGPDDLFKWWKHVSPVKPFTKDEL